MDKSSDVFPSRNGLNKSAASTQEQGRADDLQNDPKVLGHAVENELLYSVNDEPTWHLSLLLGFQHYLTMFGSTIAVPFILTPALCIEDDDPVRSFIVSNIFFVSGMITLLQCTLGIRLPIIQGVTFSFLVPTFAILNLPQWQCPPSEVMANMTYEEKTEVWQLRMRELQGAIAVSAIFQVLIGLFGIVGLFLRFVTPLTIAPAITMVGVSLFKPAAQVAGKHWGIAVGTIILLILFSQYLRNVTCKFPLYNFNKTAGAKSWRFRRVNVFLLLPVLLAIIFMWSFCAILTITDALESGSPARTDTKLSVLFNAPWFRFPYPGQWGLPTVSVAAVFGMLAGVMGSLIESIGDYYACARLSGARPPPVHAINRGIFIEGLGCIIAGLWGTGNGTTSYSENIGAIGITKVGSRRVIVASAFIMMVFGVLSKIGALFITIPEPLIGGMFCVMFGMITATGISSLQFVDLNSSRNLLVFGFSIFFSLVVSQWINSNPRAIQTGSDKVDQILTVLLSTTMLVAGFFGFFLDNTIPGTDDERGLIKWLNLADSSNVAKNEVSQTLTQVEDTNSDSTYDLPYITPWLKRKSWSTFIPFLPTFKPRSLVCGRGKKAPCETSEAPGVSTSIELTLASS